MSGIFDNTKKTVHSVTIRFVDLLVTAFGIVSALAWNDAVRSLFAPHGLLYKFSAPGPWVAATMITLFALGIGFWREHAFPNQKNPN